jgi:hypothetical protein
MAAAAVPEFGDLPAQFGALRWTEFPRLRRLADRIVLLHDLAQPGCGRLLRFARIGAGSGAYQDEEHGDGLHAVLNAPSTAPFTSPLSRRQRWGNICNAKKRHG